MAQLPHFKVASSPGHTETELSHETNLYYQYKNRIKYNSWTINLTPTFKNSTMSTYFVLVIHIELFPPEHVP